MRIFVAGASGAIGKRLVPQLVERGHEVVGMTRSKPELVRELGASPVTADGLDGRAVMAAVLAADPEVVVHEMTGLSGEMGALRKPDRIFELTNRLRTQGTDHLLAAAKAAGARKFVAQSFAGWPYERTGGRAKPEDAPLIDDAPRGMEELLAGIKHVERTVAGADGIDGIVLRYGGFYGPGTSLDRDGGEQTEMIRKRRLPVVGDGGGVWSLVHIDDAAAATVKAIEHGAPGIYNVVDDEPAPIGDLLPVLADALGAKPPRHVPKWLARLIGGESTAVMMTEIRGASNEKAKREHGWQPRYPSWREGFATGL